MAALNVFVLERARGECSDYSHETVGLFTSEDAAIMVAWQLLVEEGNRGRVLDTEWHHELSAKSIEIVEDINGRMVIGPGHYYESIYSVVKMPLEA